MADRSVLGEAPLPHGKSELVGERAKFSKKVLLQAAGRECLCKPLDRGRAVTRRECPTYGAVNRTIWSGPPLRVPIFASRRNRQEPAMEARVLGPSARAPGLWKKRPA